MGGNSLKIHLNDCKCKKTVAELNASVSTSSEIKNPMLLNYLTSVEYSEKYQTNLKIYIVK